ncbi:MAG: HD-GYP domain-containing protein [Candidatus Eisenbacteria bacterium]|nr:HD-GYP domain-containing protein [Candidatus Eisenbacteria bacterium]
MKKKALITPFRLYYFLVVASALFLLIKVTPGSWPTGQPDFTATFLVWILMMGVAAAFPVRLAAGGTVDVVSALDMAAIIILGPVYAALVDVASTGIVELGVLRKGIKRSLFNVSLDVLTVLISGGVYVLAGGVVGKPETGRPFPLPASILPLVLSGITYFLTNSFLLSIIIGLSEGRSPWRVWQQDWLRSGIVQHIGIILLGAIIAIVYFQVKLWGVLLFFVPLLLVRYVHKLYVDVREDLVGFVRALTKVVDGIDSYTKEHSTRVAEYAVTLARGMGLSEAHVETIELAALVHDLGKISKPEQWEIVKKEGSLTKDEINTIREHPTDGAKIVESVRLLKKPSQLVWSHHERPDGKGYPFGLKDGDVPMGARILNVADSFDAMTSDRPYRKALSIEKAIEELAKHAGTQFDPDVVECLLKLYDADKFKLIR